VACHNPSYITRGFPIVSDVKPGGTFLVNCQWSGRGAGGAAAAAAKRYIAENNVKLYAIDAIDLARQIGMGKRTNTILQSAFFALSGVMPAGRGRGVHEGRRRPLLHQQGTGHSGHEPPGHRGGRHGLPPRVEVPRRLGRRSR
jgi:hypothetical protein